MRLHLARAVGDKIKPAAQSSLLPADLDAAGLDPDRWHSDERWQASKRKCRVEMPHDPGREEIGDRDAGDPHAVDRERERAITG
jgi:hypothetical protein